MRENKMKFRYISAFNIFAVSVLSVFVMSARNAYAVGGISNSKVFVPSAETVPQKHVEIEPFFSFEFVDDRDNTFRFGGGVRFTVGALKNIELGANVNYLNHENSDLTDQVNDFGDIESGLKYRFLDQSEKYPFSLAYQGGVSFPTSGEDTPWFIEIGGLILTKEFSDQFSIDTDFVFGIVEDDGWNFISNIGFGYYVVPWFQAVIEGAYAYEDLDGVQSKQVFNVTSGFTSPVTDWLTIIIGLTPDLYADNTDKEVIITSAFTFLF